MKDSIVIMSDGEMIDLNKVRDYFTIEKHGKRHCYIRVQFLKLFTRRIEIDEADYDYIIARIKSAR